MGAGQRSGAGFGAHFRLAAALATQAAADGNPHLAQHLHLGDAGRGCLAASGESATISYVDFHAYVNNTGWLEPESQH